MELQSAQQKVRKAMGTYLFAIEKKLPIRANYPMIAFNNCKYELGFEDSEKFELWYDKFMAKNKPLIDSKDEEDTLPQIFSKMNGKNVSLIDSTNYLLRVSGKLSYNGNKIEIKKGTDRVSILEEAIVDFKKLKSDSDIENFRFKLHNGHSFDLVYYLSGFILK